MIFTGISRDFDLANEDQYNTIGAFWDEMTLKYGLEQLIGLGYKWQGGKISYAIGLKHGDIDGCNFTSELPDDGWQTVRGKTNDLKQIYDEIYKNGALDLELEVFYENGDCEIRYYRNSHFSC